MNVSNKHSSIYEKESNYYVNKATKTIQISGQFIFEVIDKLGARDGSGIPCVIKVIMISSKAFECFGLSHYRIPKSITLINVDVKRAVETIFNFSAGVTGFEDFKQNLRNLKLMFDGYVRDKEIIEKHYVKKDGCDLSEEEKKIYPVVRHYIYRERKDKFKAILLSIELILDINIYCSDVCDFLKSITRSDDSPFKKIKNINEIFFNISPIVSSAISFANLGIANSNYVEADSSDKEELLLLKARRQLAVAKLFKDGIKLGLLVFKARLSIHCPIQGIAGLAILATDIYIIKKTPDTEKITKINIEI